jgi:hypothetical protein
MKQRADSRRWAAAWLAGVARAIARGRASAAALDGAAARARACGLSDEDIATILTNSRSRALPASVSSPLKRSRHAKLSK